MSILMQVKEAELVELAAIAEIHSPIRSLVRS